MTTEECEKAFEEGTWLVWEPHGYAHISLAELVKVTSTGVGGKLVGVRSMQRLGYSSRPKYLRIATPNDMLKYGE